MTTDMHAVDELYHATFEFKNESGTDNVYRNSLLSTLTLSPR